jgi:TRAP-type C4-dicarboxylate transport system permease small subunit
MSVVNRLLGWLEWPIQAMLWISLAAGTAMMLHVTADATGRTLFNHPLAGTTEIVSAWYMVAICYLPWAYVARNDQHIVAGMFQHIGGPRFDYWLEILVKILTALYTAVFGYETYVRAVQQTLAGEVWQAGGIFIPVWPCRWMLPLAAALMVVYLVLRIVRDLGRGPVAPAAPAQPAA